MLLIFIFSKTDIADFPPSKSDNVDCLIFKDWYCWFSSSKLTLLQRKCVIYMFCHSDCRRSSDLFLKEMHYNWIFSAQNLQYFLVWILRHIFVSIFQIQEKAWYFGYSICKKCLLKVWEQLIFLKATFCVDWPILNISGERLVFDSEDQEPGWCRSRPRIPGDQYFLLIYIEYQVTSIFFWCI